VVITVANSRATVHRSAYLDYLSVVQLGEARWTTLMVLLSPA
jgi:hypothetical protein